MDNPPLLNIGTHGRRGPVRRDHFTQAQLDAIWRTATRVPEVVVKVSGAASSATKAMAHFAYIARQGELEIETDDGQRLAGPEASESLAKNWLLDIDELTGREPYKGKPGKPSNKLTHHLVLSMPRQTPPDELFAAAKDFAREEFALQHRYAMVLHTDQEHPHVHLVVRAIGMNGNRLRIDKKKLRSWRQEFAKHLREHGVRANATPAQVRGKLSNHQRDGVYRAGLRGASRVLWDKERKAPQGKSDLTPKVHATRKAVQEKWHAIEMQLWKEDQQQLADLVGRFWRKQVPRTPERARDIDLVR